MVIITTCIYTIIVLINFFIFISLVKIKPIKHIIQMINYNLFISIKINYQNMKNLHKY